MREILFKAKRIDNGERVEGLLTRSISGFPSILPNDEIIDVEIDINTLCQYTGLTDKNGNKIFEGDVLSTEDGTFSNTRMGYILFYKGMWTSFYGQDLLGRNCYDELHTVCNAREVIDNIFDNPELLEGGE